MNKFDQLLKEKLNKLEYPYNSAAWHCFAKKAGLKAVSAGAKIALWSVVGCASAGGAGYAVYYFANQNTVNKEITTNQSVISSDTIAQYADFVDSVSDDRVPQETATHITHHTAGSTATAIKESQQGVPSTIVSDSARNRSTVKSTPRSKSDSYEDIDLSKWRILTIDVDTIKSNR
ncbi:MAG: hypothetical protein LBL18_05035 [Bacteroidales bacterium]|jgi:hypothetical protein|nr:hypothetical protein [Bacteroidales bacterium]